MKSYPRRERRGFLMLLTSLARRRKAASLLVQGQRQILLMVGFSGAHLFASPSVEAHASLLTCSNPAYSINLKTGFGPF